MCVLGLHMLALGLKLLCQCLQRKILPHVLQTSFPEENILSLVLQHFVNDDFTPASCLDVQTNHTVICEHIRLSLFRI